MHALFIHAALYTMKDNRKYHFIHLNANFIREKSTPPIQVSKINKRYAIIDLPKPVEMPLPIPTIQLLEVNGKTQHHLSFYAKESKSNPIKSQYHYTAYFSEGNSQSRDYELHVHFDDKDQLTTTPILSKLQADGAYIPIPLSDLGPGAQEMLVSLALAHSHETMASLRLCIQEKIKQDTDTYTKKSSLLDELSKGKDENPEPYFKAIQENIVFLNTIIPYHGKEGYFASICNILTDYVNRPEISLVQQNQPIAYEHKSSPDSDQSCSDTEEAEEVTEVTLHTTHDADTNSTAPTSTINVSALVKEAEEAMLEFQEKCRTSTLEVRVFLLAKAIERTQEAYIFASDKALIQDPFDLVILQRLLLAQQKEKENLLFHLIINCQFDEAKKLLNNSKEAGFLISFERDYQAVTYALKMGKSEILEFILERTDFPINTFTIATPKGNVSAAMFCFLNAAAQSKAECLRVLVKYGASLMELCPSTGLPLAHLLVSAEKRHPCMPALEDEENIQKTLLNPSFYIQLIRILKKKPASKDLEESIKLYKNLIEQLSQNKNKHSAIEHKSIGDGLLATLSLQESLEKQPKQNLILIQFDPDYRAKREFLELYSNQLNPTSQAKRNTRKNQREILNELNASLKTHSSLDEPYPIFRKNVLETLQEEIDQLKGQVGISRMTKGMQGGFARCTGRDAGRIDGILAHQREERKAARQKSKTELRFLNKLTSRVSALENQAKCLREAVGEMRGAVRNLSACEKEGNLEGVLANVEVLSKGCKFFADLPAPPSRPEIECSRNEEEDGFEVAGGLLS